MVEPDNLLSRRQPTAAARPPQIPSLTERILLPARSLFVSRPKPPSRWVGRLALRGKSGVTAAEHSVHRVWRRDQSPPHPRRNACGRFELGYDRCTPRCCLTDFVRDRPSPPSWRLVNLITGRASRSSWRRIFRAGWPRAYLASAGGNSARSASRTAPAPGRKYPKAVSAACQNFLAPGSYKQRYLE